MVTMIICVQNERVHGQVQRNYSHTDILTQSIRCRILGARGHAMPLSLRSVKKETRVKSRFCFCSVLFFFDFKLYMTKVENLETPIQWRIYISIQLNI